MQGLTGRKDPMASRRIFCDSTAHTSQEVKNDPPSYTQQRAVADHFIKLTPTGNASQTRIWYKGHVFLCVDDVGGLIKVLKSESENYFMNLHANSDLSSSTGGFCHTVFPSESSFHMFQNLQLANFYLFFSISCPACLPTLARIATLGNNNERPAHGGPLRREVVHTDVRLGSYIYQV